MRSCTGRLVHACPRCWRSSLSLLGWNVFFRRLPAFAFSHTSLLRPSQSSFLPPSSQFVERHVHRVYVVESLERPRVCAVITLTDVLRLVTSLAT